MKNIIIKSIFALLLLIEFYPIESNSQTMNDIKDCYIYNSGEEQVYENTELSNSELPEFQEAEVSEDANEDNYDEDEISENENSEVYDENDESENVNEDVYDDNEISDDLSGDAVIESPQSRFEGISTSE